MDDQHRTASREKVPVKWALVQLTVTVLVVLFVCYAIVAGGVKGIIHALQGGIIILMIFPVLLFGGLIFLIIRWKSPPQRKL
jgi:hypothetical protein